MEKCKMCKISVVMSTFNETKDELEKAIESILAQTFKDFEFLIILDNPQNEEHKNILKKFKEKDDRIKIYINEQNMGLAKSLNKGIDLANGKYIARMDADDISMPERLEKEYNFLEKNTDISIVSTNKILIDENDRELYKASDLVTTDAKIKEMLKYMSIIVHPSVMFKKDDILKIGKYRNFKASQDYDLWLRASYSNLKFSIINEYLIKYRIREDNISNSNPLKQWVIHEYILKLYKERKKYGKDSFSEESLDNYLLLEGVFDENESKKFKKGMKNIESLKINLRNKKILLAIKNFVVIIFGQKKIRKVFYNYIKCNIIKRNGV